MPKTRPAKRQETVREPHDATPEFPVVGIGASAGGLEALKELFQTVPAESGMAFIVVQHLDPTRKGMLVELLQHASRLPVVAATHDVRVERGHVYVIPPNKDLAVAGGRLLLSAPAEPRGLRLPVDFLFRSLAEAFGERSLGVVLSGMGSDGTAGLRAIREHGGATFAQSVESAKFDGMPRSAIDAGAVDVVALAGELPEKIARCVEEQSSGARDGMTAGRLAGTLPQILALVRRTTGHDFSSYKASTIGRRIARRMSLHQLHDGAAYVRYLNETPKEAELLFAEMLIGVTSFFRDADAWQEIEKRVLPPLVARCAEGTILRAWVPACSTGEEAYSLAIAFREALEACVPPKNVTLQIFATDVDRAAIERARQGTYPSSIAKDVGPERLSRFFLPEGAGFRVRNAVRDHVVFATHNVLEDPPFTKLDLVSCRNLLIYLSAEIQKSLLTLFHYALLSDGVLFLGSAETADGFGELFAARNAKERIYRRLGPSSVVKASWPLSFAATNHAPLGRKDPSEPVATPTSFQRIVEQLILDRFAPSAVVTSARGDVLYVSGKTGKYLELPAGKTNWNVFAMAREGLRPALFGAFQKALLANGSVSLAGVKAGDATFDVTVEALKAPTLRGMVMVVFADASASTGSLDKPPQSRRSSRLHLERELEAARSELLVNRQEMQCSEEELRAANEEHQSINEELQSTNEELMTSKEEMQSMNEELQTLNHELQEKVEELSDASNDMRNLLDSTEIAILFLDGGFNVRRFTPEAAKLIRLIPGDVGRPLTDLVSDLRYPEMHEDAREVLRTLVFTEKSVSSQNGKWFRVRIMPYRTLDNRIDGLVITFTSIRKIPDDASKNPTL